MSKRINKRNLFEMFLRLGLFGFIAGVLNHTTWYQELPFCTFKTIECWGFNNIVLYIFIGISFVWVIHPFIKKKEKQK